VKTILWTSASMWLVALVVNIVRPF
jgi:hypothetical protein